MTPSQPAKSGVAGFMVCPWCGDSLRHELQDVCDRCAEHDDDQDDFCPQCGEEWCCEDTHGP
jgi:hypothetical protein